MTLYRPKSSSSTARSPSAKRASRHSSLGTCGQSTLATDITGKAPLKTDADRGVAIQEGFYRRGSRESSRVFYLAGFRARVRRVFSERKTTSLANHRNFCSGPSLLSGGRLCHPGESRQAIATAV